MASFDKEEFQDRLDRMSADEIREKLPLFGHNKKSAALDELIARGRDQELKSRSRKEIAKWMGVLCAVVLAVFALITLNFLVWNQP